MNRNSVNTLFMCTYHLFFSFILVISFFNCTFYDIKSLVFMEQNRSLHFLGFNILFGLRYQPIEQVIHQRTSKFCINNYACFSVLLNLMRSWTIIHSIDRMCS